MKGGNTGDRDGRNKEREGGRKAGRSEAGRQTDSERGRGGRKEGPGYLVKA